jgi:hypothetical protein
MPVTAKLSRRFYERFGDEITNELVDWFNSVDATYQASLRDLNETNFARFDAKLEQRIAGVESRLGARIDGVESRLGARIDVLETKVDVRMGELREDLTARLAASESRMIRWMVTLWSGSILTMVGLIVAVLRFR